MNRYDAVLVGAGIMSATLAVLLHEADPGIRILILERLQEPGLESSSARNNAGTGHAANCELNYTPIQTNGLVDIKKALKINQSFETSLELWSSLTELGRLNPNNFLNKVPHISFVWGEEDVSYLKKRFEQLSSSASFSEMEFTTNSKELTEWMPLVMEGRSFKKNLAGTRVKRGTDIDFGALTQDYLRELLIDRSLELKVSTEVRNLKRNNDGFWQLELKSNNNSYEIESEFVFLGSGGGALNLLQKSKIPESQGYGGFPVSGQWLSCCNDQLLEKHNAKVYGKAKLGSPPMSVPHLDIRWISGSKSLLFGPFAGFSSKFLKEGSYLDLFKSINKSNVFPMLDAGINNFPLINYLLKQLMLSKSDRFEALKDFYPEAKSDDWELSIAGQRVQIIKKTPLGGTLQMGTEVVTSSDGSLAALLGASPGASTAVNAMLEVVERCWPERMKDNLWRSRIQKLLPSYGLNLNDPEILSKIRKKNNSVLGLT